MTVPVFGNSHSTPLLTEVANKGFTSYYSFDFSEEKSFFKALGCGVVSHIGMTYSKVQNYINATWKPKVSAIAAVEDKYAHIAGERFSSAEYWRDLGLACSELCIQHFINVGKKAQADIIKKGGCPDRENAQAYRAMAKYFNLCITYYEQTTRGVVTHAFFDVEARKELAMFVNFGVDGSRLYLLFHKDFVYSHPVPEPIFPYFMLIGVSQGPLTLGESKSNYEEVVSSSDNTDELIKSLLGVIEAQAKVMNGECKFLTVNSMLAHNELKESTKRATQLLRANKYKETLETDAMKTVINLQASKQAQTIQRPEHTIYTCWQYPEAQHGELLTFHFHSFHQICLGNYIASLGLQFPQKPKCPLCENEELPETALDACPQVKEYYDGCKKQVTMQQRGQTENSTGSSGLATASAMSCTLPTDFNSLITCLYCGSSYVCSQFVRHGCYLCIHCAYVARYQNDSRCPVCREMLTQSDLDAISYYEMQLSYYGYAQVS